MSKLEHFSDIEIRISLQLVRFYQIFFVLVILVTVLAYLHAHSDLTVSATSIFLSLLSLLILHLFEMNPEDSISEKLIFLFFLSLTILLILSFWSISSIFKLILILPLMLLSMTIFDGYRYVTFSLLLVGFEGLLFLFRDNIPHILTFPSDIQWTSNSSFWAFAGFLILYAIFFSHFAETIDIHIASLAEKKKYFEQERLKLKEYIDTLPIGVIITSSTFEIIVSNKKAKEWLKLKKSERDFEKNLRKMGVEESQLTSIVSSLSNGQEYDISGLKSENKILKVSFSPLFDESNVLKQVMVSLTDIGMEHFLNKRRAFQVKLLQVMHQIAVAQTKFLKEVLETGFMGLSINYVVEEFCERLKMAFESVSVSVKFFDKNELLKSDLPDIIRRTIESKQIECDFNKNYFAFPIIIGGHIEIVILGTPREMLGPKEVPLIRELSDSMNNFLNSIKLLISLADQRHKDLEIIDAILHATKNKLALSKGIHSEIAQKESDLSALESSLTRDPLTSILALFDIAQTFTRCIKYLFPSMLNKKEKSHNLVKIAEMFNNTLSLYKKYYESLKFTDKKFNLVSEIPSERVYLVKSREQLELIMRLMAIIPLVSTDFRDDIYLSLKELPEANGFELSSLFKANEEKIPFILPFLTKKWDRIFHHLGETKIAFIMLIRLTKMLGGKISIAEVDKQKFMIRVLILEKKAQNRRRIQR